MHLPKDGYNMLRQDAEEFINFGSYRLCEWKE